MCRAAADADFTFVQVSDSHIGFNKGVYTDVLGTFQTAVSRINALPTPPSLVLHTGDLTHLSKPAEFDTVAQVMKSIKTSSHSSSPANTITSSTTASVISSASAKARKEHGWQSFDYKGVHFIGLVNVANISNGQTALGVLGNEQLEWLEKDVARPGQQHADRGLRPRAALDGLRKMGLGHAGCRPGAGLSEAVWIGQRSQWPHPSDPAEGGRERHLPHRPIDRLPAAGARHGRSPGPMKNIAAEKLKAISD
jgi:hypothetical protein